MSKQWQVGQRKVQVPQPRQRLGVAHPDGESHSARQPRPWRRSAGASDLRGRLPRLRRVGVGVRGDWKRGSGDQLAPASLRMATWYLSPMSVKSRSISTGSSGNRSPRCRSSSSRAGARRPTRRVASPVAVETVRLVPLQEDVVQAAGPASQARAPTITGRRSSGGRRLELRALACSVEGQQRLRRGDEMLLGGAGRPQAVQRPRAVLGEGV